VLRVHRVPYSTNVERVALAAAHAGVGVEWVDHPDGDRSAVLAVSGQRLVPVAELPGGEVVVGSMAIVERLGAFPYDPVAHVFVEWFDRVWKVAPNAIEAGTGDRAALGAELAGSRAIFEALLAAGPFLLGDELGLADVCAFPFLKWAAPEAAPADAPRFEHILVEHLALGAAFPRLRAWIERVDALPRA
jgi:maleylpyruvate isomerase